MEHGRDVAFLFEIGSLRHVPRTWRQFGGHHMANVSEHTFRVAWISLVLAIREGGDPARCVTMALLHDIPESRTGDVNYVQRLHTHRDEEVALKDILVDTSAEEYLHRLWREWDSGESLDARIVRDADNLDCDLELRELADTGSHLPRKLTPTRAAVRAKLTTASAQQIFDSISDSDPHAWHLSARNRLTKGDWAPAGS
jgi:5'-deoxynucleotidase YfbR-like HD superfamily hydrolase